MFEMNEGGRTKTRERDAGFFARRPVHLAKLGRRRRLELS